MYVLHTSVGMAHALHRRAGIPRPSQNNVNAIVQFLKVTLTSISVLTVECTRQNYKSSYTMLHIPQRAPF